MTEASRITPEELAGRYFPSMPDTPYPDYAGLMADWLCCCCRAGGPPILAASPLPL